MTRLKHISARNVKGKSFNYDLAPVTIVVGDNASGKTAVLAAVRLALLGYDPKLGRTAQGIFAACGCPGGGATEMAVSAGLTDNTSISRTWTMKRGKISYAGDEVEAIPPVMLDPTTYFALTGPARLNYVLSQVDLAALGLGCEPLLMKLNEAEAETEAAMMALAEVKGLVHGLENERQAASQSIYDWLTAVVEQITEMGKKTKATADTHEETVKGLTDGKAQDGDMTAIESVQPQINELREQLTEAVKAEANALNVFSTAERAVQEAKALAATAVDETTVQTAIAAQTSIIETAQQVKQAGERPKPAAMPTTRPTDASERAAFNAAQAKANATAQKVVSTAAEQKRLAKAIQDAKAHTNCPTCGHDITEKQSKVVADLEKQHEAAAQANAEATTAHSHAKAAEQAAGDALTAATTAITTWDALKQTVDGENLVFSGAYDHANLIFNSAQTAINTATAKIATLKASIEANAKANAAWVNLPALETASKEAGNTYAAAKAALEPIQEQIRQLESKQRQFIARTQDARRADQSRAALKTANERLAVFKAAFKVVKTEKERASEDAFTELLKHARKFTDGILKAPLEYKDGELGMTYQGNWISYKSFSGLEEVLSFTALGVALTQTHKGIRVVMLDEMGRCTAKNKKLVTNRLRDLISDGTIDQALLVDVEWQSYPQGHDVAIIQVDSEGESE
jgi:hypothetical protein